MKSKYYIPDIKDLHIGYECELHNRMGEFATMFNGTQEMWENTWLHPSENDPFGFKTTLTAKDILMVEEGFYDWGIRTSYLTPEQIVGEGWTLEHHTLVKGEYIILFSPYGDNIIEIRSLGDCSWKNYRTFLGDCPSINEFRKIVSLLNIEK